MEAALAGDQEARSALADRMLCIPEQVRIRMRRYGIKPSADEVSDVSQEIFAAIWERLERYRGDCPLEGWAYGFVAKVTLATMRKYAKREESLSDDQVIAITKATADAHDSGSIADLLALLRPEDERVIQLRYLEGLRYPDMAKRLSCTERAARARFQRAMDRLRELARARRLNREE